jgi:hypothetical protein
MVKTTAECGYIYEAAKTLMDEREKDYEGSWRREGLPSAVSSAFKKTSQIQQMFQNGRLLQNKDRAREDILDGINYLVFAYRHIDLDGIEVTREE